MSEDTGQLAERLAAVERAVAGGETAPADPSDAAATEERLARVEATVDDVDDRVSELEATTQALRGYVGGVRAVNRDVERRADLALARTGELAGEDGPPDARGAFDSLTAGPDATDDADAVNGPGDRTGRTGEDGRAESTAETNGTDEADGADGEGGIAARLRDAL